MRDIYAVGDDKMLIVTSDRLSAFDVVLADPIPDKGRVLNEMANFWFAQARPHRSEPAHRHRSGIGRFIVRRNLRCRAARSS